MSHQDKERERIARLRDSQIQARNPRKADQKIMRAVARRRRRTYKRVTLGEMLRDIPHKWRGFLIGAVAGVLLAIVLPLVWDNTAADIIGYLSIAVLGVLGLAMGQAFDARDDLRDFSRRK